MMPKLIPINHPISTQNRFDGKQIESHSINQPPLTIPNLTKTDILIHSHCEKEKVDLLKRKKVKRIESWYRKEENSGNVEKTEKNSIRGN